MPIQFKQDILKSPKVVSLPKLKFENMAFVAWSYSGIYKNTQDDSQPQVLVGFRQLIADKLLSDEVTLRRIPLTAVGQVRIGSIWQAGTSNSAIRFEARFFDVSFEPGHWRFVSFNSLWEARRPDLYPMAIHRLKYVKDENWYLEFKLPSGGKLIVSCIEFFSRCYGRSDELNRILATYSWNDAYQRFYAPLDEPPEADKWTVKLKMRLRNGDTTFLAHAKYDPYTLNAAKSIHSQIAAEYSPGNTRPLFIQIGPWFQGPAELFCSGIPFDGGRSFLAHQINGCSDPDGILIERNRENTNKVVEAEQELESEGTAWAGVHKNRLVRPPSILDLTDIDAPDHRANGVEVLDAVFLTLGIPRHIVDKYEARISSGAKNRPQGNDELTYSSGERKGNDKGIGYASLHAPVQVEINGALLDIWHAIQALKVKHSDIIKAVDWFCISDGFHSEGIPKLIDLEAMKENSDYIIPNITRKWCFFDSDLSRMRGIMVLRLIASGLPIYIVEIERRIRKTEEADGSINELEEPYRGFVTVIGSEKDFQVWLIRFMSDVRYVRGIVSKLVPFSPGRADTFNHQKSRGGCVSGESAVLKALEKMGVFIAAKGIKAQKRMIW